MHKKHNKLTDDDRSMRSERLKLIQLNFPRYAAELSGLPAEVAEWALTCADDLRSQSVTAEVHFAESVGTTIAANAAYRHLKKEYMIIKGYAQTLFEGKSFRLAGYGFHLRYPSVRADRFRHVRTLLDENERCIADGITPVIPDSLIVRLSEALAQAQAAHSEQINQKGTANHEYKLLKAHWDNDTKNLRVLYRWAVAVWGDDHGNLTDFGFKQVKR